MATVDNDSRSTYQLGYQDGLVGTSKRDDCPAYNAGYRCGSRERRPERDWLREAVAIADGSTNLIAERGHVVALVALLRATRGDLLNLADGLELQPAVEGRGHASSGDAPGSSKG